MPICELCKVAYLDGEVHACEPRSQRGLIAGPVAVVLFVILPLVTGVWWLTPVYLVVLLVGSVWTAWSRFLLYLLHLVVG